MNMVVQQTGAGVSLADGPLVARLPQPDAVSRLRQRMVELLAAAGSDVGGYAVLPSPANNPLNILGFSGILPVFAPFKSFDSAIEPQGGIVRSCAGGGGYGGIPTIGQTIPEYECEYNSLHLPAPGAQTERVIVPAVAGLAAWKQALWAIDFTTRVHDAASTPVTAVASGDLAQVGKAQNTVLATSPAGAVRGTYLGSTPLEGMWGLIMLAGMDNLAEWLVSSLTTADGATLGGFASKGEALHYDYPSPLRWFPAAVRVGVDFSGPFARLTSQAIEDPHSRSEDLAGLILGNALFFGMTDARNVGIGRTLGLSCTFDGDPFPADDGDPDGEETAHDRALAVLRVAFIDLDRMHTDPTRRVITDTSAVAGGSAVPGTQVTTTSVAHVLIALRQLVLSLSAAITQYGSADADPAADARGILNAIPIHPSSVGAPTFSARVRGVFVDNARFVRDVLTTADGRVANDASLVGGGAEASRRDDAREPVGGGTGADGGVFAHAGRELSGARARRGASPRGRLL